MALIVGLVFLGVFAVIALLMFAAGAGADQQAKQVIAMLDSALATDSPQALEQTVNLRKSELLSGIKWLNRILLKVNVAAYLQNLLHQADLKWTAGILLTVCGLCFVVPAWLAYWHFRSFLIALPVGLAASMAPIAFAMFKRSKRFDRFQEGLPEALDLMVNALRAGHSLIAAIGLVSRECADPVGSEFRSCFEEQNYGLELKTAMENMISRVPLQDLKIVSTAIMIQKESGGNLAEVLDKTSHVIRERFRLKRQVRTHTAQGRLTGLILTLLPVGIGIAIYIINPELMSLLWKTEIGRKLLWAACGGIVLGGFIINRIVNMEV